MARAGGLAPLTNDRAKPAVPFGGSLPDHRLRPVELRQRRLPEDRRADAVQEPQPRPPHQPDVAVLDAARQLRDAGARRRCGAARTGSAARPTPIYQNLNLISDERPDIVCVFGADHIYRMDPRQMVEHHIERGAGVTVAAIPVPRREASRVRRHRGRRDGRIIAFHEKLAEPADDAGRRHACLASMGNYVFDTQTLIDSRQSDGRRDRRRATDIGGDVIPALTRTGVAARLRLLDQRRPRSGRATSAATGATSGPSMRTTRPTWTSSRPCRRSTCTTGSGRSTACSCRCRRQRSITARRRAAGHRPQPVVRRIDRVGRHVERSILGPETYVDASAIVSESILLHGVRVGPGARLYRCVIDKNVEVPAGRSIGHDAEADRAEFVVSDRGVVVVEKDRKLS